MLVPFGCIGYAFVPPEKRTKLEQTREECRVLGYGDDDDTEERKGYKITFSSEHMVQYSSDVTFPKETVFQPLEH